MATSRIIATSVSVLANVIGVLGYETILNFENVSGSGFGDVITGDGNDNTFDGGAGADVFNGLGGIDTVVNCAGGGDMWRAFLDDTTDELTSAFHFNVATAHALCRAAVPLMLQSGGGTVVNISSVNGEKGQFGHPEGGCGRGLRR